MADDEPRGLSRVPEWNGQPGTFRGFTTKLKLYLIQHKALFVIPKLNTGNRYPSPTVGGAASLQHQNDVATAVAAVALESAVSDAKLAAIEARYNHGKPAANHVQGDPVLLWDAFLLYAKGSAESINGKQLALRIDEWTWPSSAGSWVAQVEEAIRGLSDLVKQAELVNDPDYPFTEGLATNLFTKRMPARLQLERGHYDRLSSLHDLEQTALIHANRFDSEKATDLGAFMSKLDSAGQQVFRTLAATTGFNANQLGHFGTQDKAGTKKKKLTKEQRMNKAAGAPFSGAIFCDHGHGWGTHKSADCRLNPANSDATPQLFVKNETGKFVEWKKVLVASDLEAMEEQGMTMNTHLYIDSAADCSMTNDLCSLHDVETIPSSSAPLIHGINGTPTAASHRGIRKLCINGVTFDELVYFCPGSKFNLVATESLGNHGISVYVDGASPVNQLYVIPPDMDPVKCHKVGSIWRLPYDQVAVVQPLQVLAGIDTASTTNLSMTSSNVVPPTPPQFHVFAGLDVEPLQPTPTSNVTSTSLQVPALSPVSVPATLEGDSPAVPGGAHPVHPVDDIPAATGGAHPVPYVDDIPAATGGAHQLTSGENLPASGGARSAISGASDTPTPLPITPTTADLDSTISVPGSSPVTTDDPTPWDHQLNLETDPTSVPSGSPPISTSMDYAVFRRQLGNPSHQRTVKTANQLNITLIRSKKSEAQLDELMRIANQSVHPLSVADGPSVEGAPLQTFVSDTIGSKFPLSATGSTTAQTWVNLERPADYYVTTGRDHSAATSVAGFKQFIQDAGLVVPRYMLNSATEMRTDLGTEYQKEFHALLRQAGIVHNTSSAYKKSGKQGVAESANAQAQRRMRANIQLAAATFADAGLQARDYWDYAITYGAQQDRATRRVLAGSIGLASLNRTIPAAWGERGIVTIQPADPRRASDHKQLSNRGVPALLLGTVNHKCKMLLLDGSKKIVTTSDVQFATTNPTDTGMSTAAASHVFVSQVTQGGTHPSVHPFVDANGNVLESITLGQTPLPPCPPLPTGDHFVPKTVKEALRCDSALFWLHAMVREVTGHLRPQRRGPTFKYTAQQPPGRKFYMKWVFKIKYDAVGTIASYKARVCVAGWGMEEGIHYNCSYSGGAPIGDLYLLESAKVLYNLDNFELDLTQAYCHVNFPDAPNGEKFILTGGIPGMPVTMLSQYSSQDNHEGVSFIEQLHEDIKRVPSDILNAELIKSLYGHPVSGFALAKDLHSRFTNRHADSSSNSCPIPFVQCPTQPVIFAADFPEHHKFHGFAFIVWLHVDNIRCYVSKEISADAFPAFRTWLASIFDITGSERPLDQDPPALCLGIKLQYNHDGSTTASMPHYIKQALDVADMTNCNAAPTPMTTIFDKSTSPITDEERAEVICSVNKLFGRAIIKQFGHPLTTFDQVAKYYCQHVSTIGWIAKQIGPSISYAHSVLGRVMHAPSIEGFQGVKRLYRFLKGKIHMCLHFQSDKKYRFGHEFPEFVIQSDASFADDKSDRHSQGGYIGGFQRLPSYWTSQKSKRVCTSTTHAETYHASQAARHAVYITNLLKFLKMYNGKPIVTELDSASTVAISGADIRKYSSKQKHYHIDDQFTAECVDTGVIQLRHVPGTPADELSPGFPADALTKPLASGLLRHYLQPLHGVVGGETPPGLRDAAKSQGDELEPLDFEDASATVNE